MKKILLSTILLGLTTLSMACAEQRSMQQVERMVYKSSNGDKIVWDFEYNKDGTLNNIEKEIAGSRFYTQNYEWNSAKQLEKVKLEYKNEYPSIEMTNGDVTFNWQGGEIEEIKSVSHSQKQSVSLSSANGDQNSEQKYSSDIKNAYIYEAGVLISTKRSQAATLLTYKEKADVHVFKTQISNETKCNYSYDEQNIRDRMKCETRNIRVLMDVSDYKLRTDEQDVDEDRKYKLDEDGLLEKIDISLLYNTKAIEGSESTSSKYPVEVSVDLDYQEDSQKVKRFSVERGGVGSSITLDFDISFDNKGRIESVEDENGNELEIEYSGKELNGLPISLPNIFGVPGLEHLDLESKVFLKASAANYQITPL